MDLRVNDSSKRCNPLASWIDSLSLGSRLPLVEISELFRL